MSTTKNKNAKIEHAVTYTVWLKRGGAATFQALSCTEVKREKRIYFHLRKDHKDREIFFRTQEIVGVTVEGKVVESTSREEIDKWMREVGKEIQP